MNNIIFNIQFEILTLILLGTIFFYHITQKDIKGYKAICCIYVLTFIASLTDVATQILYMKKVHSVAMHIVYGVYIVSVSLIGLLWLYYCVKCVSLKRKNERKRVLLTTLPAILIGAFQGAIADGLTCVSFGISISLMILLLDTQHNKIIIDRLTKLQNRYGLDEEIEQQLAQYRKDKNDSFYVIACDMDNFKTINDSWGHAEGDRALKLVAEILTDVAEKNNAMAFRNGGDEFIIITDKAEKDVAENICNQVEEEFSKVQFRDDFTIRISMGIALYDGKTSVSALLNRADGELYAVKQERKN